MRFGGNKFFVAIFCVLVATAAQGAVDLGIDVLQSSDYTLWKRNRVGLVTNQAGVNSHGVPTRVLLKTGVVARWPDDVVRFKGERSHLLY